MFAFRYIPQTHGRKSWSTNMLAWGNKECWTQSSQKKSRRIRDFDIA